MGSIPHVRRQEHTHKLRRGRTTDYQTRADAWEPPSLSGSPRSDAREGRVGTGCSREVPRGAQAAPLAAAGSPPPTRHSPARLSPGVCVCARARAEKEQLRNTHTAPFHLLTTEEETKSPRGSRTRKSGCPLGAGTNQKPGTLAVRETP